MAILAIMALKITDAADFARTFAISHETNAAAQKKD
jgi:hypothetical protein